MNSGLARNLDPSILGELAEQVFRLLEEGREIDLEQLAAGHPEYRERLREIVPILRDLNGLDLSLESTPLAAGLVQGCESRLIGDYRILRQIGRGGMGVVYEAEQLSMPRRVALKILPLASLIDPRALQRFKNEVAAVATLQHPNIVGVYSVGEERGIHYYAMQLIHGQSLASVIKELRARADRDEKLSGDAIQQAISDGSAEEALSPTASPSTPSPLAGEGRGEGDFLSEEGKSEGEIETVARGRSHTARRVADHAYFRNVATLICQAAEALQHAHDHGIIHRDIKPGNLLLDTRGTLYVTDFGLARIETGAGVTMTGDVLGTLRYMSPEQVQANRTIVDHRTDVYSLGATLYELLTLRPMWVGDDKGELIRQISIEEPAPPRRINPSIPTDLETIVLKALSKNPDERYATAQALADDLRAWLDLKPILARRPTIVQRVNKWTRRNPEIVWASSAVLLISVSLLAISNVLIMKSRNDTRNALKIADTNLHLALDEAATTREINAFLNDLLGRTVPHTEPDRDLKVRDVLDRALASVPGRFAKQPLVEAEVRISLGSALDGLGQHTQANQQMILGYELYRRLLGADAEKTLRAAWRLSWSEHNLGRYKDAFTRLNDTVERSARVLGANHELTLTTTAALADIHRHLGNFSKAESLLRDVDAAQSRLFGTAHHDRLVTLSFLAALFHEQGRFKDEATAYSELLAAQKRVLPAEHRDILFCTHQLANAIAAQGQFAEAEELLRGVFDAYTKLLGPEHPGTLRSRVSLGSVVHRQGRYIEAEKLIRDALALEQQVLGAENPETIETTQLLANTIADQGRLPEAESLYRSASEAFRSLHGPEHPDTIRCDGNLALILGDLGRFSEAEQLFRHVLAIQQRDLKPDHPNTLISKSNLAVQLKNQGKFKEAEQMLRETLDAKKRTLGPMNPSTLVSHNNLASAIMDQRRFAEAESLFREVVDLRVTALGPDHPNTLISKDNLATSIAGQGRYGEAEQLYRENWEAFQRVLSPSNPQRLICLFNLGGVIQKQKRFKEAESVYREVLDTWRRELPLNHPNTLRVEQALGITVLEQGRYDEAEVLLSGVCKAYQHRQEAQSIVALESLHKLAEAIAAQGRYDNAAEIFDQACAGRKKVLGPDNSDTQQSARCAIITRHAIQGQWKTAAQQFSMLERGVPVNLFSQALSHLGNKDPEGYSSVLAEMESRFGMTNEPGTRFFLTWLQVLRPIPAEGTDKLLKDAVVLANSDDQRQQICYAAVLARCGKPLEAIERLLKASQQWEAVETKPSEFSPAVIWYFLAMACQQAGDKEQAVQWLARANEQCEIDASRSTTIKMWDDQLINPLLQAEVEHLLLDSEK